MQEVEVIKEKEIRPVDSKGIENLLINGNLESLNEKQRIEYYSKVCDSLGLNPLTKPFDYIKLSGKLTLYANKNATEQLRKIYKVSILDMNTNQVGDVLVTKCKVQDGMGRTDVSTGAVTVGNLRGDALANAIMKSECVPLSYKVLTKNGFKSYDDVNIGELVAGVNTQTKCIEWGELKDKKVFRNQKTTKYKNNCVEFVITNGHKFFNGEVLKEFESFGDNERIYFVGLSENKQPQSIGAPLASLLGWIITDGSIKKYNNEISRIGICQSKVENFKHIEKALKSIGGADNTNIIDNKEKGWQDQKWWWINKEKTYKLLSLINKKDFDDLRDIVCNMNYEERISMQTAMELADADKRGAFGKGNLITLEIYQILLALNGIHQSKISTRFFEKSTQPFYEMRKYIHTNSVKRNLYNKGEKTQDVWCPTTTLDSWICKTDKGQVFLTGNTKAKRRATLSICGLGMLDESELETIKDAYVVPEKEAMSDKQIMQTRRDDGNEFRKVLMNNGIKNGKAFQEFANIKSMNDVKAYLDDMNALLEKIDEFKKGDK